MTKLKIDKKTIRNIHPNRDTYSSENMSHLDMDDIIIIMKRVGKNSKLYSFLFEEVCKRLDKMIKLFASNYSWSALEYGDIYSMGIIGINKAIENWDPDRFSGFTTAVYFYIRKEIRRNITEASFTIRPPYATEGYVGDNDEVMDVLNKINNIVPFDVVSNLNETSHDNNVDDNRKLVDIFVDKLYSFTQNGKMKDSFANLLEIMALSGINTASILFPISSNELKLIEDRIHKGLSFDVTDIMI